MIDTRQAKELSHGDVLASILKSKDLYIDRFGVCMQARPSNVHSLHHIDLYFAAAQDPELFVPWIVSSFHVVPELLTGSTSSSYVFRAFPSLSVHERPRAADQAHSYHRQEAHEPQSSLTVIHQLPFESSMESRVRASRLVWLCQVVASN